MSSKQEGSNVGKAQPDDEQRRNITQARAADSPLPARHLVPSMALTCRILHCNSIAESSNFACLVALSYNARRTAADRVRLVAGFARLFR